MFEEIIKKLKDFSNRHHEYPKPITFHLHVCDNNKIMFQLYCNMYYKHFKIKTFYSEEEFIKFLEN